MTPIPLDKSLFFFMAINQWIITCKLVRQSLYVLTSRILQVFQNIKELTETNLTAACFMLMQ